MQNLGSYWITAMFLCKAGYSFGSSCTMPTRPPPLVNPPSTPTCLLCPSSGHCLQHAPSSHSGQCGKQLAQILMFSQCPLFQALERGEVPTGGHQTALTSPL
ncbi:hypothetical protein FKM82_012269 [Ascaphus truei]